MIKKTEIFKKIGTVLAELNEQYQYITENPDSMNELELELFAANSEFLNESARILKKYCEQESAKASASPVIPDLPVPAGASTPVVTSGSTQSVQLGTFKTAPAEADHDHIIKDGADFPADDAAELPATEQAPSVSSEDKRMEEEAGRNVMPDAFGMAELRQEAAPLSVVDDHSAMPAASAEEAVEEKRNAVPTLNELLSAQKQPAATRFSSERVKDLRSIINLNDKLIFIKDLFNGYSLAYSEAIEIVNRAGSYQEARNFLEQNYAIKNGWSSKEHSVQKLEEILHRRFE